MENRTSARVLIGTFTGEDVRAMPELSKSVALSRFLAGERFTTGDFYLGIQQAVSVGWIVEEGPFIRLTNLGLAELPSPNGSVK